MTNRYLKRETSQGVKLAEILPYQDHFWVIRTYHADFPCDRMGFSEHKCGMAIFKDKATGKAFIQQLRDEMEGVNLPEGWERPKLQRVEITRAFELVATYEGYQRCLCLIEPHGFTLVDLTGPLTEMGLI